MNKVYLVGAGCGKDLLTLRGAELLRQADCVVYDSLLDESLLELCREDCVRIFAGKRSGGKGKKQEEINRILLECGRKYAVTVRLKGGDPYVFGRGGEEMLALLSENISCESVPGVTSAIAAAELAGIPVTHRRYSRGVHIVTAQTESGFADFSRLAGENDTLVILMGKSAAEQISAELTKGGMSEDTPCAVISQAGSLSARAERGRLCDLPCIAQKLPAPQVIVIGKVCTLDLAEKQPMDKTVHPHEISVAVTGTAMHAERVCGALRKRGIAAENCACLRVVPLDFEFVFDTLPMRKYLVFTSANGVKIFFERALERGEDFRIFGNKKFAAIGAYTAQMLARYGFRADCIPKTFTCESLYEILQKLGVPRKEILLLRSAAGDEILEKVGEQADLYDTVADADMLEKSADILKRAKIITFGSANGARAVLDKCVLPSDCVAVCIGEKTAEAVRGYGCRVEVCTEASADAVAETVGRVKEKLCKD